MALAPGTRLGAYEVIAQIGVGGMGEVYRATDTNLGRQVALKVLPEAVAEDADRLARFDREARTLAALNHPNIAAIYGLERSAGTTALVMELVEGPTLADLIAGRPEGRPLRTDNDDAVGGSGLPVDEALAIAKQIADALEAAHEQGIIHRDLKPANIKVRPDGTVKVLDFGLAKMLEPAGSDDPSYVRRAGPFGPGGASQSPTITTPAMTQAGMILGTAAYMSPEQAKGRPADRRSDVWAFSCVLYEMLTGRRAFEAEDVSETLAAVLMKEPDLSALPTNVPPAVRLVIQRGLQKDRRQRMRDIGDARLALDGAFDLGVVAPEVPSRASRLSRAVPWTVAAASLLVVLALVPTVIQHAGETESRRSAARFTVELPSQVRLPLARHVPVLSPDGRYVVFVGQTASGESLWLRSLESLDVRELPGTLGARGVPFWSPDSQYVAFVIAQRLWRLRLTDGVREPVAELPGQGRPGSGSWSRSGDILVPHGGDLLLIRSGQAQVLPVSGGSGEGETFSSPRFLPDGRRFLYYVQSNSPDRTGLYVGSLDGGETALLEEGPMTSLGYAEGHVVYVRDGFLAARPFDPDGLVWTGEPRAISEQGVSGLSVSSNGLLAHKDAVTDIAQLTWVDRSGRPLGTLGPPDRHATLDLAPDGRRVVVSRGALGADQSLWILGENGAATRLTSGSFRDTDPRWSSDASRIVFVSTRAPGRPPHEVSASGGSPALVMPNPNNWQFGLDDWSPDGRYLLYHQTGGSSGLWVLPLEGERKPVSVNQPIGALIDQGQFSPDGRFIAYNGDESGTFQVYVEPFPSTGERWQVSQAGGAQPVWRADGRELFFLSLEGELMSAEVDSRTGFRVTGLRPLFKTALRADVQVEEYAVAPSGDRFLMALPVDGVSRASFTIISNWESLLTP